MTTDAIILKDDQGNSFALEIQSEGVAIVQTDEEIVVAVFKSEDDINAVKNRLTELLEIFKAIPEAK